MKAQERKVVLVTRRTRLEELVVQHHTLAQARFYLEHLGADFGDYVKENAAYAQSLATVVQTLQAWGRYQIVERAYLPNFVFAPEDIVVALGQDGLVANTLKYLDGQPLIGLNPEPARWDGVLLPFAPRDLTHVLLDVAQERRSAREITMAEARLDGGQTLRAVNDLFIGARTHTSALYDIALGQRHESQSSSGVIVSTGLGSTAWIKSVVTGSLGIAQALQAGRRIEFPAQPWDSAQLIFAVREPFPSKHSRAELVYGAVSEAQPLLLRSQMSGNGVIFSDGIEADYLRFDAGMQARIGVAATRGRLVV